MIPPGTTQPTPTRLTLWQRLCELADAFAFTQSIAFMPHLYASPHYDRSTLVQSLQTPDAVALLDAALAAARDAGRESVHAGRRVFQEQADRKAAAARDAVITALGLQARRATSLREFLAAERCDLAP